MRLEVAVYRCKSGVGLRGGVPIYHVEFVPVKVKGDGRFEFFALLVYHQLVVAL